MAFRQVSILGVGLMGGSVGLALRSAASDVTIVGYSHNALDLQTAVDRGAIHEATTNPVQAVSAADLVILAVPVGVYAELMSTIAAALSPGAIVTDLGSTKESIVRLAEQLLRPAVKFVGSHPMVGGEKHGIQNARADLLTGALCIVTPAESTDAAAADAIEEFWENLKMRTARMTPAKHDQLTADISHLPHAIAAALVRTQSQQSLAIAARGFLDTTRIAGGDPALWRDIFVDNRENLKAGIARIQAELAQLTNSLDRNDSTAVEAWLRTAAELKNKPPTLPK